MIRPQPLPPQELVDPLPLVVPVAAGREAVPREIQFADLDRCGGGTLAADDAIGIGGAQAPVLGQGRRRRRRRSSSRPASSRQARRQMACTAAAECDTNRIVLPRSWNCCSVSHALLLEVLVADREDLVEQEDVGIELRRDREAEPHLHAGRIVLQRHVHEVAQPGVGHDRVVDRHRFRAAQAVDRRRSGRRSRRRSARDGSRCRARSCCRRARRR